MNKQKELPNVKLQKTSVIFMQLGLILALFSVYVILEHKTIYKVNQFADVVVEETDEPKIQTDYVIVPDEKVKVKKPKKVQQTPLPEVIKPQPVLEIVPDTTPIFDTPDLLPTDDEPETPVVAPITVASLGDEDDDPEDIAPIDFIMVEIAPAFPSCDDDLSKIELRACFNEKMKKHVNRKFNTELAQELGLSSGKKRINIEFIIDEKGEISILRIRAPHKKLQKEAKRVVDLLPIMIPGKQQQHNVRVKFNLPIVFMVE